MLLPRSLISASAADAAPPPTPLQLVLGYWLALFVTVVLEEHFIFRKGSFKNYRAAETWNDRSQLPVGWAALAAFAAGAVGAAMGMSQAWYVGPIGILIGERPFGGDIGFELAAAFAGVVYVRPPPSLPPCTAAAQAGADPRPLLCPPACSRPRATSRSGSLAGSRKSPFSAVSRCPPHP